MPSHEQIQRQRYRDIWTCDDCGTEFIVDQGGGGYDDDTDRHIPLYLYLTENR